MSKRHTRRSTATPFTPASITDQSCPACGAILPDPIGRLDDIPGQAHLRRAVTVALTGNHSITFIGVGASLPDALAFGRISRRYGLTAYVTTPCICGNAGDPFLACQCTPEAVLAWRKRPAFQAALQADLVVEAALTSVEQRMAHRRGRRGETDEQLIAQATEARSRPRPSDEPDGVGQRLLAAAIRQLQLTTEQIARVLAVAQSIAQLADVRAIGPVHLAEALQYRSRIAVVLDLLEPGSQQEQ
jgi:magnesium chelatase family protein